MDATPNALAPLNRTQGWTTGMLLLALAATRLIAASSYMSTEPLPVATDWRTLSEDAVTYDMPAYNLLAGYGYSGSLVAPHEPSALRTPTYPLTLAAVYTMFGRSSLAAVAANVLFDFIAAVFLFGVARRKLPAWWAIAFLGAVVVLAPWSCFLGRRLTEPLATMLVSASLYLLMLPASSKRWLGLGVCLGMLVMCRPVFALLPVVLAFWALSDHAVGLRKDLARPVAAMIVGVLLCWGPWTVRNAVVFDRFIPLAVAGTGLSLWASTWHDGGRYWQVKEGPDGEITRTLPDQAFASDAERKRVVPAFDHYIELFFSGGGGLAIAEPDRKLREVALDKIRERPVDWMALRARRTVHLLAQRYFITGEILDTRSSVERARRGLQVRRFFGQIAWVIAILSGLGILLSVLKPSWRPVSIVFLYTWLIHFPTHALPRYLAPGYGAAMLLAIFAIHQSYAKLRHRV
jgi:4-amino-4-deoxy-L-arabinose transferase-like glycosyltransferase